MADFRRWFIALAMLALFLGSVAPASAQLALVCTASAAVTPTLRHEGFTELTGDILLNCLGAPGATPTPTGAPIPQANISVSLSAPVTSRILTGGNLTDALLVVDDPAPGNQDVCLSPTNPAVACLDTGGNPPGATFNNPHRFNVFQGIAGGPGSYSVTFLGIPVDPPATSRTYRITNIRVDATSVPSGAAGLSPVFAFVSASPSSSIQINNPQNYVGFVSNGLTTSTSSAAPSFLQCQSYGTTKVGTVTFTENFATAFKTQGVTVEDDSSIYPQNTPGTVYYTESGLQIAVTGGEAGVADSGTELQTTISNIPTGVTISVDSWAASPAETGTVWSDATLISPVSALPDPRDNSVVDVTDGSESSVTVVWEVTNTNSVAIDSLAFNIYASFTGAPGTPGTPTPNLATGALSGFSPQLAAYSATGPIPEFSSTVNVPTAPTTLFTVSLCQTILLFPYVTDYYGFDTGIAISNTSSDPLGTGGAVPQSGACSVNFYGANAANLGTSGVYSSTADTTLTDGLIPGGTTWAFSLSGIDPGYNSAPGYGTTGYAIAICNFQYAHGYSFVSDTGIRNFAAAYLALIIPDAPRSPMPFFCSEIGCLSQTGEQLVH